MRLDYRARNRPQLWSLVYPQTTDSGHMMAKSITLCSPNSYPKPKQTQIDIHLRFLKILVFCLWVHLLLMHAIQPNAQISLDCQHFFEGWGVIFLPFLCLGTPHVTLFVENCLGYRRNRYFFPTDSSLINILSRLEVK